MQQVQPAQQQARLRLPRLQRRLVRPGPMALQQESLPCPWLVPGR
jgi:hypothetical protein